MSLLGTDGPSKDLQENSPSEAMTIVVKAMSNQGPMSGSGLGSKVEAR